jgi:hypothetical protein
MLSAGVAATAVRAAGVFLTVVMVVVGATDIGVILQFASQ